MIEYLLNNASTLIVLAITAGLVVVALVFIIKRRKKGDCSGDCSACPYQNNCQNGDKK